MAIFPDGSALSKFHQALSRRSLMRMLGAAGIVSVAPAVAAPPPRTSPWVRLHELTDELQIIAKEIDPSIKEWIIDTKGLRTKKGVPLFIAAFNHPPGTEPVVNVGWKYRHGVQS